MTNYPYRMQLVVDPDNPRNVVAAGSVSIYDSEDTAKTTLLTLTDPSGVPIPNPITSNANGFTPPFVTTSPEVLWVSGPYTDYFQSYKGMRDEAVAAKAAAETAAATAGAEAAVIATEAIGTATDEATAAAASAATAASNASASATAAANAAALVGAPADSAVAALINASGSAARGALNATYAPTTSGAATAQPVLSKIRRNVEDVTLLNLSDSTGVYSASENRWAYMLCQRLAADWPTHSVSFVPWDTTTNAWGTPMVVSTGTGAQKITFWNAAITGSRLEQFMGEYWGTVVVATQPDLVFTNYGLNDGSTDENGALWYGRERILTLTESITEACPNAAVMILTQNERQDVTNKVTAYRASAYAKAAQQTGHGYIDVRQAFRDDPRGLTALLNTDNLHPNNAGSTLIADTIHAQFQYNPKITPRGEQPSSFSSPGKNLLTNGDFSDPISGGLLPGWTTTASTVAADATLFEGLNGYSIRVQSTGSTSQSYIYQNVDLSSIKGKWITLAARVYVPAGQNNTAARIAIDCGLGATDIRTSSGINTARNGWQWFVISKFIDPASTFCRIKLYGDTALTASADVRFGRVSLVLGQMPREAINRVLPPSTPPMPGLMPLVDMLSTLGGGTPSGNYSGTDQTLQGVGIGSAVEIIPHRNFTLKYLDWRSGTVVGGNYDIGVLDASGTVLWKKGGTAYPTASTDVTEDLSATPLALTAGTKYYVVFTGDSATATVRGISAPSAIFNRKADGTYRCRGVSGSYPLGTSHTLGSGGVRTPMIVLREA